MAAVGGHNTGDAVAGSKVGGYTLLIIAFTN
jgi:hypothetical protein